MNNTVAKRYARMLAFALVVPAFAAPAAAQQSGQADDHADDPVQFAVAAGVQVRAQVVADGQLEVLLQPSGKRQRLRVMTDADGRVRLGAEDVDFDGHPELVARASVGMVNEAVAVFRYDPAHDELRPLQVRSSPQASCDPLMMLSVDRATRTLSSSCRSGPMWYVDLYRFDGPQLYLYRSQRMIHGLADFDAQLQIDPSSSEGPLAVWSTFNREGATVQTLVGDALADPPVHGTGARVLGARLPLYRAPGDADTRRYLVRGDRVELLDERDGWLQVRYANPTRGAVEGWVNSRTAPP